MINGKVNSNLIKKNKQSLVDRQFTNSSVFAKNSDTVYQEEHQSI